MTSAQSHIAETLEIFYGAADRTSDGAMAGHAYKRSVDDLDSGFGRELVCTHTCHLLDLFNNHTYNSGRPLSNNHIRTPRQNVCLLSYRKRARLQTKQEGITSLYTLDTHL